MNQNLDFLFLTELGALKCRLNLWGDMPPDHSDGKDRRTP